MDHMDEFNPIRMMTDSGARGSISQVSQLAGMRGMMASPTGRPLEMPVKRKLPRRPDGSGILPELSRQP